MVIIICLHATRVHLRMEEKMSLTASREGGLQNLEVLGIVTLKITNDKFGRIKVAVRNSDNKGIQLQVPTAALYCFRCDTVLYCAQCVMACLTDALENSETA